MEELLVNDMKEGAMEGSGTDVKKRRASADVRLAPKFYREPLGRTWLLGLAFIPLLIALIGYVMVSRSESVNTPATAVSTTGAPPTSSVPRLSLSPLSISRNGNAITVGGNFPNDAAKAALMKAITSSYAPGINVIDQIRINPEVKTLDFANAGPVFVASVPIPDFTLTVNGDTVTLTGTATAADQKNAVEHAGSTAWPGVNVVGKIVVNGQVPPSGSPSPGPPPGPPPGPGACNDLQKAVNAATGGPIYFGNDGVSFTPATEQGLTQVASQLKTCPNAHVTINGYTDNSGSDSVNLPLSIQRADSIAEFLIAHGVARDHVVAKGLGSANPIAPNDTNEGRAKNRRAEIVVS